MNQFRPGETNPFVPDEVNAGELIARQQRRKLFSATHWWIIATLWFVWTIIYMSLVVAHLSNDPERLKSLILTPLFTAVAPLLGAMLRGFQGCCLQVSLSVLFWTLPIPIGAALLQWCWNPQHLILRIIRMLIWMIAWMVWFASGILPLGHAFS
ncbi:MAG: hypothetical protein U0936_21975 [Planctomycetaceae bacterium]